MTGTEFPTIATTEELVKKLGAVGAKVELVVEDNAGHQRPDAETVRRYREWLKKVIHLTGEETMGYDDLTESRIHLRLMP